jgi:hypothetical protein
VPAGLSLEKRQQLRKHYLDAAVARGEKMGLTLRCQRVADDLASPDHQSCRGEQPGGTGCLCRCHDHPADGTAAREDQRLGFRA